MHKSGAAPGAGTTIEVSAVALWRKARSTGQHLVILPARYSGSCPGVGNAANRAYKQQRLACESDSRHAQSYGAWFANWKLGQVRAIAETVAATGAIPLRIGRRR
jgi:hypothetical protein